MAKIDTFNLDMARAAGEAEVADMIATVKSAFREKRKRDGRIVIAAAYTMVAALRNGVKNATIAKEWGPSAEEPLSTSTVTLYRRLALAVDHCGVEVGDRRWSLLSGKAGANIGQVGRVLEGKPVDDYEKEEKGEAVAATSDRLDWILGHAFTPDGKKRTAKDIQVSLDKERGLSATSDDDDSEGGEGAGTGAAENQFSPKAQFLASVARMVNIAPDLSTAEWESVQDALAGLTKALRDKATFEKKAAAAAEKATA